MLVSSTSRRASSACRSARRRRVLCYSRNAVSLQAASVHQTQLQLLTSRATSLSDSPSSCWSSPANEIMNSSRKLSLRLHSRSSENLLTMRKSHRFYSSSWIPHCSLTSLDFSSLLTFRLLPRYWSHALPPPPPTFLTLNDMILPLHTQSLEVSLEILIEVTCNFDTTSISDELVTILLET